MENTDEFKSLVLSGNVRPRQDVLRRGADSCHGSQRADGVVQAEGLPENTAVCGPFRPVPRRVGTERRPPDRGDH